MIDLNPKHLETIQHILAVHIPECEVRAFGSRVKWTAKDYSDLDLAVVGSEPLPLRQLRQLTEAFEESYLPIQVDVVVWQSLSDGFRKVIAEKYEVIQEAKPTRASVQSGKIYSKRDARNAWQKRSFGKCASLVREVVSPSDLDNTPYIGLEHIGGHALSLLGHGVASDVTSTKTRFKQGDILFGKLRCYFRKVVRAPFDGICSTDIWVTRATEGVDQGFLFYCMASQSFVDFADSGSEGTRMPRTQWGWVSKYEIPLPSLSEQRQIAHILSSLDDKIELNRQMNETLEAMARAIFKSWFVNFDPVRAKMEGRNPVGLDGDTAALFPSTFQDSPLGKIPEGWDVDQVKNRVSRIQYGFTQSASEKPVGPKFLRITDIANKRLDWASVPFCHITEKNHDKYRLQEGDIFVARTGATTGANIYIIDPPDAVFASYLVRIQFHDLSMARLVGEFMASPAYDDYVVGCIGGSAQPNASAQLLSAVEFVFPPPKIAKQFYNKVYLLDKKRAANDRQSHTLLQIRDALLPKLLSGEIRVDNMD